MTETMDSTVDLLAPDWAQAFHAAATAAAAALGLEATPTVGQPAPGSLLPVPATLAAAIPVAGAVQGELLLHTTAAIEANVDDRTLGGLTALSPRVRAMRAAADALGLRHGDPREADVMELEGDLAAVLSLGDDVVGVVTLRQRRPEPEITVVDHAEPEIALAEDAAAAAPAPETTIPQQTGGSAATAPAAPAGARNIVGTASTVGPGPLATRLDQITHVEMEVTVEIGRTRMSLGSLLGLAPGQVVELDRPAGSPVDLYVNGTLLARGEVVVVDEDFGFRVTDIVSGQGA
jgi:flagellar motor switch protein FliN/FliY